MARIYQNEQIVRKCLLAALEAQPPVGVDHKYEAMYGGRADLKAAIDPVRELHPTVYHTDDESNTTHSTCHQRQRGGYPSPSAGHDTEETQRFKKKFRKKTKKTKKFSSHTLHGRSYDIALVALVVTSGLTSADVRLTSGLRSPDEDDEDTQNLHTNSVSINCPIRNYSSVQFLLQTLSGNTLVVGTKIILSVSSVANHTFTGLLLSSVT
jgi:hypothetical protein